MPPDPPFVNTPRQKRSRETLDRLLLATRELLADAVLEEITVQQIVDRAGCSVGTFYQRFKDKDAVLPHLLELHYAEFGARMDALCRGGVDLSLYDRVDALVQLLVAGAVEERGLIRALVLRNHQRPESIPASIRDAATRIVQTAAAFLLASRDPIRHPRPLRAIEVGLLMVASAVRERIILAGTTQAATLDLDTEEFGRELAIALHSYLGASEPTHHEAPS